MINSYLPALRFKRYLFLRVLCHIQKWMQFATKHRIGLGITICSSHRV